MIMLRSDSSIERMDRTERLKRVWLIDSEVEKNKEVGRRLTYLSGLKRTKRL